MKLNLFDADEGSKFGKRFVTVLVGAKLSSTVGDGDGSSVGSLGSWVPVRFVELVVGFFVESESVVVGLLVVAGVGASTTPTSSIMFDGDPVRITTGLAVGIGVLTTGGLVIGVTGEAVGLCVTATTGLFVG